MQRIIVKNFGPLKDIDLEIKDYMVFLGPQASGKSTLAKLIYGFKEVIRKCAFGNTTWTHELKENKVYFKINIEDWRFIFKNYFFTIVQSYSGYQIEYHFDTSFSVVLTDTEGEINVKFSDIFIHKLVEAEDNIRVDAQKKVNYNNFKDYPDGIMPDNILIEANQEKGNTTITLDYNSISFNEDLNFPYSVPDGYDRIIMN